MPKIHSDLQIAYEDSGDTVRVICKRFQISSGALNRLANQQGWKKRRQTQIAGKQVQADNIEPQTGDELETLAALKRIARKAVAGLEASSAQPAASVSSADRERNVRSLRTLLKTVEEITAMENQIRQQKSDEETPRFDDKKRQQLAKLIAALAQKSTSADRQPE